MSVLSVPRIFFKGQMAWNPATINNNDQWPTYDFVNANLNWDFLASQTPPITPANAEDRFPTWAQTLQYFASGGWWQPPAEWNYYGGNESRLHTATAQTLVTGGQLSYGGPVVTDDALVGAIVELVGDPFPESRFPTDARLVDTNPDAFWSSSFFVRSILVGNQAGAGRYLKGDVEPGTLASNRWMFLQRNLNVGKRLEIAGIAGGVLQTCLPNDTLSIGASESELLQHLDAARRAPGVKGVMVRLSAYMTRYFTAPEFGDCSDLTDQYTKLVHLWADDLENGRAPTQNPAVSLVVGSIGLWMEDELVSVPGGRFLVPAACVPLQAAPPSAPQTLAFGPVAVEVHADAGYVTLDLGNAVPELDSSGAKANCGTLHVVLTDTTGRPTTLGAIPPNGYAQPAYESAAGIVDVALASGVTADDLTNGTLSLVAVADGGTSTTALEEVPLTVQTDDRALWVDQGATGTFAIHVREKGAVPAGSVSVLLQQYLPVPPPPAANAGAWSVPSDTQPAVISFENAPAVVSVPASEGGTAQVQFSPIAPGFPAIAFFPFRPGEPPPQPPTNIIPVFVPRATASITTAPTPSITTAFFATARVMPFDDDKPQAFASLWNSTHDAQAAWDYLYENVLGLYSLLFPIMKYYAGLNLGSREAVDRNIALILRLCDESMTGSSLYMPVTRDLSAGKRRVLQMYGWLVENGWPHEPPLS